MTIFDFKRQKGAYRAHSTIILDKTTIIIDEKSEHNHRLMDVWQFRSGSAKKFFAGLLNSIFPAPSSILAKAGGAGLRLMTSLI